MFITEYGIRNGRGRKWKELESARKRERVEEQEVRKQNKTREKVEERKIMRV